jgi:Outer membrane protein beta-barrel domain
MKKILLLATAIFTFGAANAQSNEKGTIHLNVLGGFITGAGTDKFSAGEDFKFTGTGAQFGVQGQYGLSESISAGIGFEFGSTIMTPKNSGEYLGSPNVTMSTFKVNLSGRYYIVNKDKFNFFAGPSVGFTTGKEDLSVLGFSFDTGVPETKFSGLNLGLNTGVNFYFSNVVGAMVQVGYESNMLKSKANADQESFKRNIGGVKIMGGVSFKF